MIESLQWLTLDQVLEINQSELELKRLLMLVMNNLKHYLNSIGERSSAYYTDRQNRYCHYQKQNPHTPKVMAALGLDPQEVQRFIEECLFPELVLA